MQQLQVDTVAVVQYCYSTVLTTIITDCYGTTLAVGLFKLQRSCSACRPRRRYYLKVIIF